MAPHSTTGTRQGWEAPDAGETSRTLVLSALPFLMVFALGACSGDGPATPSGEEEENPYADILDINGLRGAVTSLGAIGGMKACLVFKGDRVVAERYFNGAGPDSTYHVFSSTKSVTSALIGIAIDQGFMAGVDDPLSELLSSVVDSVPAEWGRVTLGNLLTMTAGHDYDPLIHTPFTDGPVPSILALPVSHEPGSRFVYSGVSSYLLSVVLTAATGMTADEYAHRHLFGPLGWGPREWIESQEGYTKGSSGLYLSARNMLDIGLLYLRGGSAGGQQLVSSAWVDASTARRVQAVSFWPPYDFGYGYQWWVGRSRGHDHFSMMGLGGQYTIVFPDLGLAVVTLCDPTAGTGYCGEVPILEVILELILPAVG